nr:SusC/RagA family TonB-linked outer membrane protein [uncultured Lacibacter sp.]
MKFSVCMCLLLFFLTGTSLQQVKAQQNSTDVTVSGVVKDAESNQGVAGVTISIAGKKLLVVTNADGSYSVTVPRSSVLLFTAVSYEDQGFVAKDNQRNRTILLKSTAKELEGVVVTALGITRKQMALGYSATTIDNEDLTDAKSANWIDALSGKVAGLNMVRSGSGPTASNKIILRGENNLTGDNEALIVVDGVVINQGSGRRSAIAGETVYGTGSDNMPVDYGSNLNDINPEDIESVTILKGPGAAALYGQRGANGAVIITTKSGNSKKKGLGVTFNSNMSIEQVNRWPDLQYEYGQGLAGNNYYSFGASADGASTSATSSAYGPRFNGQSFYQFDPVTQAQGTQRTPWVPYKNGVNSYFNTGKTFTNSVTIDGGTDKTTARFSMTNVANDWITPNTGYQRNSVSLSVNSKVSDRLQISSKATYNNRWSDNLPGAGYGNQSIMYWYIFWQPSADPGWLKNYWANGQENKKIMFPFSSFPENPYAIAYEFLNSSNRHAITGNIQASYSITKELSLQLRTSIDQAYEERAQKRPYDAGSKLQKGSLRTQNLFSSEMSADFLLRYNKKFSDRFELSFTGGGSLLRNKYKRDETRADSLIYPGLYSFANSAGPLVSMPFGSRYAINSFYGIFTASYDRYLFFDITGRQDWNSVLATPDRTTNAGFFYPSANVGFVLSNLTRMPKYITYAKLRASAASVGSGGTIPYLTAYNYESAGSLFAGGLQAPGLLANPNLRPLRTNSYEAGVELKMFKNRLSADVTVYTGTTKDQHLRRILDRASGYTQVLINAGKVNNRGVEVALSGTPVKNVKGLTWTVSTVFSTNRNEIMELLDSSVVLQLGPVGGGQIVAKVGGSMGDMYGRGYVRSPDGQIVYDTLTGNALISQDVVYIGNTIPKYKIGITNQFTYKQFRFSFLFDAQLGAKAHSLMHYKLAEQGKTTNTLPGRYNGIIGNGVVMTADGKYRTNDVIATNIDEYYRSHYGIDNAEGSTFSTDFVKLREVRLDYTLPIKLVQKLKLQKASLGVYGRDLFIWSPWPMFDPEFGTLAGTDIVRGFETGQFPSTRTMGVNLTVSF